MRNAIATLATCPRSRVNFALAKGGRGVPCKAGGRPQPSLSLSMVEGYVHAVEVASFGEQADTVAGLVHRDCGQADPLPWAYRRYDLPAPGPGTYRRYGLPVPAPRDISQIWPPRIAAPAVKGVMA